MRWHMTNDTTEKYQMAGGSLEKECKRGKPDVQL